MDRIDLFRVFTRVVECASFTRAAASLGLPRSSVSAAIQELEGRIGARLLHRTTRKVAPTQDGATLYERCLRLIAERRGAPDARLEEFRWLLEELRVSLFAQELRTPQPVSVKRLEKAWAQLSR